MRLSVELPGLLVAGPDSAQDLLGTVAAAARNLNIPTTQVSSRAVKQGSRRLHEVLQSRKRPLYKGLLLVESNY